MLTIEAEDQVTLKVTVAEVSRSVVKQLGFNTSITGDNGGISFQNPTNLGGSINWRAAASATGSIGALDLSTYVNAMEQAGVMRTLAEPSLTASPASRRNSMSAATSASPPARTSTTMAASRVNIPRWNTASA